MQEKKLSTKAIVGIVVGVLAILAVILAVILMNKNKLTAMVMRLIRQEGEVALLDASGQDMVIMDNMKLYSGNALQTGSDGLVDLSLDDTKYLTIEKQSQVVFEKSGKALELKLNSGRLFFNVTEKLADDETMDISTSTMVVGIRGTSGWVDAENSDLYIGDGTVHVTGINPETGDTIEADFTAGQKVHVYLISKDGKTVAFELENYTIEDVPREMLRNIVQYPTLFKRFVDATGFEPKAVIREAIIKEILPGDMVLPEEYEELLEEVIEEMKEPEEEEEEEPEEVEEVETPTTNPTTPRRTTQTTQPEETPPAEEQPPAQQQSTPAATTPTTYNVSVSSSPAEGGSATPSVPSAEAGASVTLTATPSAGYKFLQWTVTEGGATLANASEATTTLIMAAANAVVTASFEALPRDKNVTVQWSFDGEEGSVEGGVDNGSGEENYNEHYYLAYEGESLTITATPATGYKALWSHQGSGNFSSSENSATLVAGNSGDTVTVNYELSYRTLVVTLDANTPADFSATCNGSTITSGSTINVQVGETVTITGNRPFYLTYSGNGTNTFDFRAQEDAGGGTSYSATVSFDREDVTTIIGDEQSVPMTLRVSQ
ncbi:FecR family protein [Lachnospiraceae bacterium XBD2001]|nr:FecR family protein [Lachnospiraceae bacterium XBD2001]